MAIETKADVEAAKARQEELTRRLETRTHVPNPVPEITEAKAAEVTVKKLKVEKVFINKTFQVSDGKDKHIVGIPLNRADPKVGDTVTVNFTGDKDEGTVVATWPKEKDPEPAKAAK